MSATAGAIVNRDRLVAISGVTQAQAVKMSGADLMAAALKNQAGQSQSVSLGGPSLIRLGGPISW